MMAGTMIMTMTMMMIVVMVIMMLVVVMMILVVPVEKDQGRVPRHKAITIGLHLKLVGSMFFYQPQYSESSIMRVFRLPLITSAIVCAALILPKREAGKRLRWPILEIFSRNDISKLFSQPYFSHKLLSSNIEKNKAWGCFFSLMQKVRNAHQYWIKDFVELSHL